MSALVKVSAEELPVHCVDGHTRLQPYGLLIHLFHRGMGHRTQTGVAHYTS